jgi:hypothetical protein
MVPAAERNSELITDFAAQCLVLQKSEMMGICRPPAAYQAGMLGDRSDVIPVTHAAGFRNRQRALINRPGAPAALRLLCSCIRLIGAWRRDVPFLRFGWVCAVDANGLQLGLESLLEDLGIFSDQCVLLGKYSVRPDGGLVA